MIITLAIVVLMVAVIISDKLPFGAPALIACALLVVTQQADVATAFSGFANNNVIMIMGFMVCTAALQKTTAIHKIKGLLNRVAKKGGIGGFILLLFTIMVVGNFITGTAFYVLIISMERFELAGENCLYYLSSQCRSWRPAKSIFLFAPNADAVDFSHLEAFAANSGWLDAAEKDGAVLILPAAPEGWEKASNRRLKSLYKAVWQDTSSPDPREVLRNVWCWETLIFAVGYGEGAVFAGDAAVAHPNLFAQTILVNGVPHDYLPAEEWKKSGD